MARHPSDTHVLGARSQLTGRVTGSGSLRIDGTLTGDVSVTGPVDIGAGARVEGDIQAASLEVAGRLSGDVTCQGSIVVRAGAEVRGRLQGASVAIEPGSRVDVRLDTHLDGDSDERR